MGKIDVRMASSGLSGAAWCVFTLALFFGADSLLFRTGWYDAYLEPDSSAGTLESQLYWLASAPAAKVPEVLVIGDSRIAEGFSPRVASSAVGHSLHFWNFGIGGATPRVWYYALRAADPTRRRFSDIVIALDNYSDKDWFADFEDRVSDQNYLVMRLGLGDCIDFTMSLHSTALRHSALFGCLFRGMVLRPDVQSFLSNPAARIAHADDWDRNGLNYATDYTGMAENLTGLAVDWRHRTLHFPEGVNESRRTNVIRFVLQEPVPQKGEVARYRRRWLGGILDLYKDSPTRLIFLQLPRGPLVNPKPFPEPNGVRFVDSAAHSPHVTVWPADTFTDLERPEVFADGLHLNREGRPIFSARLAEKVRETETSTSGAAR